MRLLTRTIQEGGGKKKKRKTENNIKNNKKIEMFVFIPTETPDQLTTCNSNGE